MGDYEAFLASKSHTDTRDGFEPLFMPDFLFDFQKDLTSWAIEHGRVLLTQDCGTGKTPELLVWAENVVRHTNKPAIVLAPLGVVGQIVREAEKFEIEAKQSRDGTVHPNITVTNYHKLHLFNPDDFGGIVLDEAAILKSMSGAFRRQATAFMRTIRYRLLDSACVAPNDPIEFGTASEALGHMGNQDMLSTFYKTQENSLHPVWHGAKWMFKAHAEERFWRWLCTWNRAMRRPSDLGYEDGAFILPELLTRETVVTNRQALTDSLFVMPAVSLDEQREERKLTLKERCEMVAQKLDHPNAAVAWCHLNAEGDLIEDMIPGCAQIAGCDSDEKKEEILVAFATGQIKKIVSKPSLCGWGLNWQHCRHTTVFPSHSAEQYYQLVRRFWRFGQTEPVVVDLITTEGEIGVLANLNRKCKAIEDMFDRMVRCMNDPLHIDRDAFRGSEVTLPDWLSQELVNV